MRRDDFQLPVAPDNDRPSDSYHCGFVCIGGQRKSQSCPLGPTARGVCRHDKDPCSPIATAQLRMQRWQRLALIFGIAVLAFGFFSWGPYFYKPGDLSTPHAQILSGQLASASCAACHPQAASSPLDWFRAGHPGSRTTGEMMLQSDSCMDCHHTRLPRDFARTAHNLPPIQLQQLRDTAIAVKNASWNQSLPRPAFDNDDVACAACHREHAGAGASLTALTDTQCQTCHSNRFTSFALDHPAWQSWPYSTTEPIAFDHRSHAQKHFPNARDDAGNSTTFDCLRCHTKSATGEFSRTTNYASSCGSCHDKALHQQVGERLDLIVVPSLIAPNHEVVGNWPVAATGFYDGKVGPLARLLIPASPQNQNALKSIPGDGDFARINPDVPTQRTAAQTLAIAIRDTIEAMATSGPIPLTIQRSNDRPALRRILRDLPPQLVWDASQRWFHGFSFADRSANRLHNSAPSMRMASAREAVETDDSLLGDDGELSDPLSSDPLLETTDSISEGIKQAEPASRTRLPVNFKNDPVTMQPDGGWYVDDSRMSISYRGHGHADPVIQAAIELAAGLGCDDSIRRDLLNSGPASACTQCHRGALTVGQVQWKPEPIHKKPHTQFTKFSHRPHMNMPVLADCKHCHAIRGDSGGFNGSIERTTISLSNFTREIPSTHDFTPIEKQVCASCHTTSAAGDACIKCHRYHTEPPGASDF